MYLLLTYFSVNLLLRWHHRDLVCCYNFIPYA